MEEGKPVRRVKVAALVCRCTRCGHEWVALGQPIEAEPEVPDRCAKCRSPYWRDERGARPRGRPPKAKHLA